MQAIVAEVGGITSHSAILARAMGDSCGAVCPGRSEGHPKWRPPDRGWIYGKDSFLIRMKRRSGNIRSDRDSGEQEKDSLKKVLPSAYAGHPMEWRRLYMEISGNRRTYRQSF